MPLSPYLSNVFLGNFDKVLERNSLQAIRYVDDIVVFCSSENECKNNKNLIEVELKKIAAGNSIS